MKKIYLFAVTLICAGLMYAQSPAEHTPLTTLHIDKRAAVYAMNHSGTINKTEADTLEHYIAFSQYNSADGATFVAYDSAEISYQFASYYDQWKYYSWDGTMWKPSQNTSYTYDADWNWTGSTSQIWDGTDFVNSAQQQYTYDAFGDQLTGLYLVWGGTDWNNFHLYTYTYNADHYESTYLSQDWSGTAWVNDLQDIYERNADNLVTTYTEQTDPGTGWMNVLRNLYTYNADNEVETITIQIWDGATWVNSAKDTYTYNLEGETETDNFQIWSGTGWQNNAFISFTYNVIGQLENILVQFYDLGTMSYVNNSRTIYGFDADYNNTSQTFQTFAAGDWVNVSRSLYDNVFGDHFKETYEYWGGTDWLYSSYTMWYYETYLGINSHPMAGSSLTYPSPFTNQFMISVPGLETGATVHVNLYAMNGDLVYSKSMTATPDLNIVPGDIPPGNYQYSVVGAGKLFTGKVVKAR